MHSNLEDENANVKNSFIIEIKKRELPKIK